MCSFCSANKLQQAPSIRNEWPINKIETSCYEKICTLLDLTDRNKTSILVALGCFSQTQASLITQEFRGTGGIGVAHRALSK